jgi:hypothetical protein
MMRSKIKKIFMGSVFGVGVISAIYLGTGSANIWHNNKIYYNSHNIKSVPSEIQLATVEVVEFPKVSHMPTPEPVKAIYMTQCVVGTRSFREKLVNLIEQTELNSVVIDIKDYSGTLAFVSSNPLLRESSLKTCGASDMREFLQYLHDREIYIIGRITVFQDPHYTALHPELAVKKASATSSVWRDHKGLAFIDVGAKQYWDYIIAISREAYNLGFDELNYDYIRFPSDGPMNDIYYPWSRNIDKQDALEQFFVYLNEQMRDTRAVLSADLFGMTTTNTDDLNIGQVLERAMPYFDYIAPMVYPSHYPRGFMGFAHPASVPYDIVKISMQSALARVQTYMQYASTTSEVLTGRVSPKQLRPWLQDFNLGAVYTPEMVRAQIDAVYDAGLTSWMLWDSANTYTREALLSTDQD